MVIEVSHESYKDSRLCYVSETIDPIAKVWSRNTSDLDLLLTW